MRSQVPQTPSIRADDLVLSLAQELRVLQRLVADLPVGGASSQGESVTLAQNQDLVEQTLGELASFLQALADSIGPAPLRGLQPALDAIRLAALAGRLKGETDAPVEADGELEFL